MGCVQHAFMFCTPHPILTWSSVSRVGLSLSARSASGRSTRSSLLYFSFCAQLVLMNSGVTDSGPYRKSCIMGVIAGGRPILVVWAFPFTSLRNESGFMPGGLCSTSEPYGRRPPAAAAAGSFATLSRTFSSAFSIFRAVSHFFLFFACGIGVYGEHLKLMMPRNWAVRSSPLTPFHTQGCQQVQQI